MFFLMIRRPPRSTPLYSSAASDVYKRQCDHFSGRTGGNEARQDLFLFIIIIMQATRKATTLVIAVSYTHLRAHEHLRISYAVFCLKKKNQNSNYPDTTNIQEYTTKSTPLSYSVTTLSQRK